jgi:hypothetical protein
VPARRMTVLMARVGAYGMAAVAGGILAYTGVSAWQGRGGDAGPAAAGAQARPLAGAPGATSRAPTASAGRPRSQSGKGGQGGGAVPPGSTAQLGSLAGTWLSYASAKDYLVFTATGQGAWKARSRTLWQGRVIPAGPDTFRLAWQGTGRGSTAYWQVKLIDGGRKLIFNGTNQQYLKIR